MTMKIIALAAGKGGAGKTTSAMYLENALTQLGQRVALVDADPQGALTKWAADIEDGPVVVQLQTRSLHKTIGQVFNPADYDIIIIDSPGHLEGGITASALKAVGIHGGLVVVPLMASMMELRDLPRTIGAVREVEDLLGEDLPLLLSLNRTRVGATATKSIRGALQDAKLPVARSEIKFSQPIAKASGSPITGPLGGYISLAEEILEAL